MNIIHKINFDEDGNYKETFLYNGEEITESQFRGLESDLKDENEFEDYEFEDYEYEEECQCCECNGCCEEELDNMIFNRVIEIVKTNSCPVCIELALKDFADEIINWVTDLT